MPDHEVPGSNAYLEHRLTVSAPGASSSGGLGGSDAKQGTQATNAPNPAGTVGTLVNAPNYEQLNPAKKAKSDHHHTEQHIPDELLHELYTIDSMRHQMQTVNNDDHSVPKSSAETEIEEIPSENGTFFLLIWLSKI